MSDFSLSVSFEELRALGQTLMNEAERMKSELAALAPKADPDYCWRGSAASAYWTKFEEWKSATQTAIDALNSMGPMLKKVADAMDQQNSSIAQQILSGA